MVNVRVGPHPQFDGQYVCIALRKFVNNTLLGVEVRVPLQLGSFLERRDNWIEFGEILVESRLDVAHDFLLQHAVTKAHHLMIL